MYTTTYEIDSLVPAWPEVSGVSSVEELLTQSFAEELL